jgi:hypothetical protein
MLDRTTQYELTDDVAAGTQLTDAAAVGAPSKRL